MIMKFVYLSWYIQFKIGMVKPRERKVILYVFWSNISWNSYWKIKYKIVKKINYKLLT
jgi:hypothetical protein